MIAVVAITRVVLVPAVAGVMALALSACSADGEAGNSAVADVSTADSAAQDSTDQTADSTDSGTADTDATDSSGMPDVCAMLSPAEIESAVGFAVSEWAADADRQTEHSSLCEWTSTGGGGFVAMAIAPGSSIPYGEGESAAGTAVAVDIPGANEAYTLREGQSVGMSVNGDYIVISLAGAADASKSSAATSLATLVASRY